MGLDAHSASRHAGVFLNLLNVISYVERVSPSVDSISPSRIALGNLVSFIIRALVTGSGLGLGCALAILLTHREPEELIPPDQETTGSTATS